MVPIKTEDKAQHIVDTMSAEDKVGQLLMVGILTPSLDQDASWQLSQFHLGNVILFDRNMESPEQVKRLTGKIRQQIEKQSGVMPFIALDQEGGKVLRMRSAFPAVPSEAAIGQGGDPAAAKKWAVTTGTQLKNMGINVNFAPVVDLGSPAERSYSIDPAVVTAFAQAACSGYSQAGIWCSLKHFPGIGKVKTDPHIDGDSVKADKEELMDQDLKPFANLIKTVPKDTMFIMVSNVTFPALDAALPACVSQPIMTDLLRNQLHYDGLIVSDDMEMGAMAKHYAFADMGVMAIKAGADMVLVCHDYGHEQETYTGLLKAYTSDPDFKRMVDEKVLHIVRVKLALQQDK
ncbi:MAG: beta-N-acetylhexosaminidase [Megasphaera sp.]|nr:beta-N-acetylhexosaminidase [Megasphaera sp.]MCH4188123.1 beta-N-acetylhexosaminidase [Megasphaera sp.]